ncbi:hypothetical protein BMJ31_31450 [Sinorhizobium medicae]|nr:hypothetical protein BMJ31_31450 [Sinorhizobium medicae]
MISSHYRWVIVAAGGLLGCIAIGAMFSLPVFLVPISRDTGWSVTGISSAMTVGFLAMALASMVWGSASDRWGPRPVVLIGSALLASSLALSSFVTSLIAFQLIFGVFVGGACAAIFAPMMACVTGWFDTHRSLAVSLVSAGMGMAPMTMSPLAGWLITIYDWRTSLQIIAAIAAVTMIPAAMLLRRPPVSLEGLAGMGGRVAFGILGDRYGAKRILVSGLLLQAFGALAYFFVRDLGAFYAVAALFGFIYAGVMPLYAVIARENFPLRMMGTVIGGTAMAGSLGMAIGPVAGGVIYDVFASYGWLYIGAWGIGIGAFLIALTFKPFPKRRPAAAAA